MNPHPQRALVCSIEETGHLLGLSRSSIYKMIRTGELNFIKLGGRTLIRIEEIEALLNRKASEQAQIEPEAA